MPSAPCRASAAPQPEVRVRHETAHQTHFPASRGLIPADMSAQTFVSWARNLATTDVDAARRLALSGHPIGRLGVLDDIAKGIVFLASDDAGFMTGAGLVAMAGRRHSERSCGDQSGSASRTATPSTRPSAACTIAATRS
jgi:hypothetical protein